MAEALPDISVNEEPSEPGGRPDHDYVRVVRHPRTRLHLPYVRTRTRAIISFVGGAAWVALSVMLARPWIAELGHVISLPLALIVIAGIAWLPGYLNMQLLISLLLDHQPPLLEMEDLPDVTVLVAAYNEEANIERTISSLLEQEYPGGIVSITVIDDGSVDRTADIVAGLARFDPRITLLRLQHGGKAAALNAGLAETLDWVIATVDADTHLHCEALCRSVTRMMMQPLCVAVAGSLVARNADENLVTRAQAFDYLLAISSVKREQALLQSTLVAQGAFSVYLGSAIAAGGGWSESVGEDIVLTWALLERGGTTSFEPTALAWTEVPATVGALARQRRRWARGMVEGLRAHGWNLITQHRLLTHSIVGNFLFPLVDGMFTFAFLPGLALAITGRFLIVGPMTLAVLPISAVIAFTMHVRERASLAQIGIAARPRLSGFLVWLFAYQLLMSPVALMGYIQELSGRRRVW